jgi:hypothetical protein
MRMTIPKIHFLLIFRNDRAGSVSGYVRPVPSQISIFERNKKMKSSALQNRRTRVYS